MAERMELEIVSSTENPVTVTITELYIPAYFGEAGVLENHKPYISLLQPGEVFYTDIHNKKSYLYIKDGFLEVNANKMVIISDTVEKGENLKKDELQSQLEQLDQQIKSLQQAKDMSPEELQAAPEKWDVALAQQQELRTKLSIIAKIESGK